MRRRGAPWVETLSRERASVYRQYQHFLPELAIAIVHGLSSKADLAETVDALYLRLAALDIAIASADPQAALFLDM